MNLRVKELCREHGLTMNELAEQMGMKRESLSRAVNGNPTLETLEKIAEALGVPITELFEVAGDGAAVLRCPHCGQPINLKID